MTFDADVVIAGSGLNGSALALALASGGLRVALVDPQPTAQRKLPDFDGRGYALSLASHHVLAALGIWDMIAEHAEPILDIKVSDGRAGEGPSPLILEFDHAEIGEAAMGYVVEDRYLRRSLLDAIKAAPRLKSISGVSVTAHQPADTGVTVSLSDGTALRAHLLIGSDGKTSAVAKRSGIRRTGWRYGQTSLVCAVEHERPHHGIAHQFFMPEGPLAILPLPGDRSSIVWTESDANAAAIQALGDTGYLEALRPRFGDFLGDISLGGARFAYPLELSLADRFIADRVALVGDAAHAVHPIAGQGLNAGLKDVAALAEVLVDGHRRGEDIGRPEVLARYQRWRRFDTATLAIATDTFNKLFSNDNNAARLIRDLGLGLANKMPGLKRGLIREAAGITGDLPRLSRGRPI